jgi:acyl-CoA reductase-like NAD-dependent aldehyde dehydrogenase
MLPAKVDNSNSGGLVNVLSLSRRSEFLPAKSVLISWREQLRRDSSQLLEGVRLDLGRDIKESFWLEWSQVESAFKFLISNRDSIFRSKKVYSSFPWFMGRRKISVRRIPVGHVLIVGTWNFPLGLHLTQILFALAAGNHVTFKGSPHAKNTGDILKKALSALTPTASFKMLNEDEEVDCIDSIKRGDYQLVVFTGGTQTARIFARACAESLTPLTAEASGSEIAIFTKEGSENFLNHLDHLIWSLIHNGGQTCVAPRVWFVQRKDLDEAWKSVPGYIKSVPEKILKSRPKIKHAQISSEQKTWEDWGMKNNPQEIYRDENLTLMRVDHIEGLDHKMPPSFGAGAIMVGYDDLKDVVKWSRQSVWSLMTTIFGNVSKAESDEFGNLDTGLISINEAVVSAGDASLPFGGRRMSGYGLSHGKEGLLQMSRPQVLVKVSAWFGISKAFIRPGLLTIEKINKLSHFFAK